MTALTLSMAALPAIPAQAAAGFAPGKVNLLPSAVDEGSTGNEFAFDYNTPKKKAAAGSVAFTIPAGWTAPQTINDSLAGFVGLSNTAFCVTANIASIVTNADESSTITVTISCPARQTIILNYSDVTAPSTSGSDPFTVTAELNSATAFLPFVTEPSVTVMPRVWSMTGGMTTARRGDTATLLPSGLVLVAGGSDGTNTLSSAELYDPTTGTWSATGSMASARTGQSATLLPDGEVLVAGGFESYANPPTASAELYDPASGTWAPTGSMTKGRSGQTATLLSNGKVLVAGGVSGSRPTVNASAELYDPGLGTWSKTGSMPAGRIGATATLLANGKILVAGGTGGSSPLASAELYHPGTGTWSATGSMAFARSGHTATLLPTGKVLVAGGRDSGGESEATSELYDPATGTFTGTGAMVFSTADHTATLLPNGEVLVAGGFDWVAGSMGVTPVLLAGAEVYDPSRATWSETGSMLAGRADQIATLLPNGTVLVAGGDNASDQVLNDAELFQSGS
jgi:N-acetylneuraminic acid mutarotase